MRFPAVSADDRDMLPLIVAGLAFWALIVLTAVSLCVAAARSDAAAESERRRRPRGAPAPASHLRRAA